MLHERFIEHPVVILKDIKWPKIREQIKFKIKNQQIDLSKSIKYLGIDIGSTRALLECTLVIIKPQLWSG